jgi:succinate dehydrogenase / fumarate reductase flavoprotein subunit
MSATGPRVGPGGLGVHLDFADSINRLGRKAIAAKYGNLGHVRQITGEDLHKTPMRIYPAVHYTMGGLWVDYDLQSNLRASTSRVRPILRTTVRTGWAPAP